MSRALALALLIALVVPAAAAAATRPPIVRVVDRPLVSDARSVAGWKDRSGAVRVLGDEQPLGGETRLIPPPDCALGGLSATDVGYDCAIAGDRRQVRLQDRRTGAVRDTPITFPAQGGGGQVFSLSGIGTTLAAIADSGGNHDDGGVAFQRLDDGRAVPFPSPSSHRALSLDTATADVPICAPLKVTDDLASYVAPWMLTVHRHRVLLRRCGSARARDLGPVRAGAHPVLTARYAAWAGADGAIVRVHVLAGHRTWSYRLPLGIGPTGPDLVGTDHRLWVMGSTAGAFLVAP